MHNKAFAINALSKTQKVLFLLAITAITLAFFHLPDKWIYDPSYSVCLHRSLFGIGCPLCGMTRALYGIIHLNPILAIRDNFAVIPFILTVIIGFLYILSPSRMKKTFITSVYITLAAYTIVYIMRLAGLY